MRIPNRPCWLVHSYRSGQLDKARELVELLSHKRLLEQKYGDLDGIVHDITGGKGQSEVDTF